MDLEPPRPVLLCLPGGGPLPIRHDRHHPRPAAQAVICPPPERKHHARHPHSTTPDQPPPMACRRPPPARRPPPPPLTGGPAPAADTPRGPPRLALPKKWGSCHTALIDGYLVEGHVPASDVRTLLRQRPKALGLAVPGMPIGSPRPDGPPHTPPPPPPASSPPPPPRGSTIDSHETLF